ncbi:ribosomal protein S8 [Ascodesmis nigricans]|uniref:Ribosomal protein S8 n=1 Tax=Ascodesmis nigricans TaxID=341454 RepID=A0A4S2N916_9PEZI|nr:ribosomal protein S8 [Ascodesmis nigricans]
MSLVTLAHACSHLQNAVRASLGVTSIPATKQLLEIALNLQNHGFVSSVTRGSTAGPDEVPTPTTQANIATRRLWIELKYHDNTPVMKSLGLVSQPKRKVYLKAASISNLCQGKPAQGISPLQPGEVMFISTDKGIMEARDCAKRWAGGQALCRVK